MRKIFFLILIFFASETFAQKNIIKKITGKVITYGDTIEEGYVKTYNEKGQILTDYDNLYHIILDYYYNEEGKIIEENFLFGESFSNGNTKYIYAVNSDTLITAGSGYYNEKIYSFDNKKDTIIITEFYVSGIMPLNLYSVEKFIYNRKNQIIGKEKKTINKENNSENYELHFAPREEIKAKFNEFRNADSILITTKIKYNYKGKIKKLKVIEPQKTRINKYFYSRTGNLIKEKHFDNKKLIYKSTNIYSKNKKIQKTIDVNFIKKTDISGKVNIIPQTSKSDFFYDNNSNLEKVIIEKYGQKEIQYFKNNLLIKKELYDAESKLYETNEFSYKYF